MASPVIRLHAGFNPGQFQRLLQGSNSHLSRFKESSMDPLVDYLSSFKDGQTFSPQQKEQVQNLIFYIPADKQTKYKAALQHLADALGVQICGCPVKPKMALAYFGVGAYAYPSAKTGKAIFMEVGSYHHVHKFTWESSTGDMSSLRHVGTREHVKFRTSPSAPPFNYLQASVPQEFHHGESYDGANYGFCQDDHSTKHPSLICANPRVVGELVAEQWYQFTTDRGKTWRNIPNAAYLITKGVRDSGGKKVFFFKKQNWDTYNPRSFKFEVEFLIGDQPAEMPPMGTKLDMQSGNRAELSKYAYRVVSMH